MSITFPWYFNFFFKYCFISALICQARLIIIFFCFSLFKRNFSSIILIFVPGAYLLFFNEEFFSYINEMDLVSRFNKFKIIDALPGKAFAAIGPFDLTISFNCFFLFNFQWLILDCKYFTLLIIFFFYF